MASYVDYKTAFFVTYGAKLLRLLPVTTADQVVMTDGSTLSDRLKFIEKSLALNTSVYFADTIEQRDALAALTPGDQCFVKDATGDGTVAEGGAMYMWLPELIWRKMYEGDSPLNAENVRGYGLKVQPDGRLAVDLEGITEDDLMQALTGVCEGVAIDPMANRLVLNCLYYAGKGIDVTEDNTFNVKLTDEIDLEDSETAASAMACRNVYHEVLKLSGTVTTAIEMAAKALAGAGTGSGSDYDDTAIKAQLVLVERKADDAGDKAQEALDKLAEIATGSSNEALTLRVTELEKRADQADLEFVSHTRTAIKLADRLTKVELALPELSNDIYGKFTEINTKIAAIDTSGTGSTGSGSTGSGGSTAEITALEQRLAAVEAAIDLLKATGTNTAGLNIIDTSGQSMTVTFEDE